MLEVDWFKNKNGFTVEGTFFSPISMLSHIERLPSAKIVAKKSWFLTDDFEGFFTYKGFLFVVETPFAVVEVCVVDKDIPLDIRNEVLNHAVSYKWVNPFKFTWALVRYLILPFNPRATN